MGWCAAAAGGGAAIRSEAQGERKGWAKNPKTERSGSVLGLPCQTAVENDRGRWRGDVDKVVVVVCMRVRARTREEGQKNTENPKTEPLRLRFGWIQDAGGGVEFCGGHRAPSMVA